jgi:hypothetical protein
MLRRSIHLIVIWCSSIIVMLSRPIAFLSQGYIAQIRPTGLQEFGFNVFCRSISIIVFPFCKHGFYAISLTVSYTSHRVKKQQWECQLCY